MEQLGRLELDRICHPLPGGRCCRMQRALQRLAGAARGQALTRSQVESLRDASTRLARAQTELVTSERLATVGRLARGESLMKSATSPCPGHLSLARMKGAIAWS